MIIRGSNHAVRIRRGEDKGSEKKVREKTRSLSFGWISVRRAMRLIIRL